MKIFSDFDELCELFDTFESRNLFHKVQICDIHRENEIVVIKFSKSLVKEEDGFKYKYLNKICICCGSDIKNFEIFYDNNVSDNIGNIRFDYGLFQVFSEEGQKLVEVNWEQESPLTIISEEDWDFIGD